MAQSGIRSGNFSMLGTEGNYYIDPINDKNGNSINYNADTRGTFPAFGGVGDEEAYLPRIEENKNGESYQEIIENGQLGPKAKAIIEGMKKQLQEMGVQQITTGTGKNQ